MSKQRIVSGIILSDFPLGENDRRLSILTKECGKMSVIARGCRKTNSHLHAIAQAMTYGEFQINEGRNYNYLVSGECRDSFSAVKCDLNRILYATYFCELAGYYCPEGQREIHILNLLFVTFAALKKDLVPLSMIRRIYEFKILQFAGYGMQTGACLSCGCDRDLHLLSYPDGGIYCDHCGGPAGAVRISDQVHYALAYTAEAPLTRIYSFALNEETRISFERVIEGYFRMQADHRFRSAAMLDEIGS